MAWSGTYTQKILSTLNGLADSQYQSEYKDKINSTADQIANYGDYNSKYQPDIDATTDKINNYGEYQSKYQPDIDATTNAIRNYGDYSSKYQNQIDDLMNRVTNWNYDAEADPEYQAYKKQYTDLGNKAMRNTLGQLSARTGGLASSYAGSAAQQSYQDYMGQLANIIPQLSDKQYNRATNNLGLYQNMDAQDYNRWQNALQNLYNQNNMYQNLDNTDYTRWQNALQNLYSQGNYLMGLDNADYAKWQNAFQNLYNQNGMYLNMDQNAYNQYNGNLSSQYQLLSALYNQDDRERAEWEAEQAALMAAAGGYGGGGGGYYGGGSSSSGSSGNITEMDIAKAALEEVSNGTSSRDVAAGIKSIANQAGLTGNKAVQLVNNLNLTNNSIASPQAKAATSVLKQLATGVTPTASNLKKKTTK